MSAHQAFSSVIKFIIAGRNAIKQARIIVTYLDVAFSGKAGKPADIYMPASRLSCTGSPPAPVAAPAGGAILRAAEPLPARLREYITFLYCFINFLPSENAHSLKFLFPHTRTNGTQRAALRVFTVFLFRGKKVYSRKKLITESLRVTKFLNGVAASRGWQHLVLFPRACYRYRSYVPPAVGYRVYPSEKNTAFMPPPPRDSYIQRPPEVFFIRYIHKPA